MREVMHEIAKLLREEGGFDVLDLDQSIGVICLAADQFH